MKNKSAKVPRRRCSLCRCHMHLQNRKKKNFVENLKISYLRDNMQNASKMWFSAFSGSETYESVSVTGKSC